MTFSAKRKIAQLLSEASTERKGPQALYNVTSLIFFFFLLGVSGPWLFFFLEKLPKASCGPVTPTAEQISKRRAIRRYGERKEKGLVSVTKLPVVQSAKSHNHQAKQVRRNKGHRLSIRFFFFSSGDSPVPGSFFFFFSVLGLSGPWLFFSFFFQ